MQRKETKKKKREKNPSNGQIAKGKVEKDEKIEQKQSNFPFSLFS